MQELNTSRPTNLFEYLELLRSEIPLRFWVGSNSLHALQHLISGFEAAQWAYGINADPSEFIHFNAFVETQYQITTTKGWPSLILEHCEGDENSALDEFYRLLQLFKQSI